MAAITTLASVVLGAVLALAGGIWTERWKQRKEAKAAARLVWLELMIGYSNLFAAVALEKWPARFTFPDDAWMAQRERLALVMSTKQFQELQTTYLTVRALAEASPGQRADPVLCWPTLVSADRAVRMLGEAAGVERAQLAQFHTPLQDRLADTRSKIDRIGARPGEGQTNPNDVVVKVLDQFPPELRARAAEVIARTRPDTSEPRQTMNRSPEPADEDSGLPRVSGGSST